MDFGILRSVAGQSMATRQATKGLRRGIGKVNRGQRRRRLKRKTDRKFKSFMGY
jgi:hypothetical protein